MIYQLFFRLREGKQRPEKLTIEEFDRRITEAFQRRKLKND